MHNILHSGKKTNIQTDHNEVKLLKNVGRSSYYKPYNVAKETDLLNQLLT